MIIALDPGFGNTKVMTSHNGNIRSACITTSIVRNPKMVGLAAIGMRTSASNTKFIRMKMNENLYIDFATGPGSWKWGEPMDSFDYSSISSAPRLAMFFSTLSSILPPGDYIVDSLVIGLPVNLLQNIEMAKETFEDLRLLKMKHLFDTYRMYEGERTDVSQYSVNIKGIDVLAQPVGAYADYLIGEDCTLRHSAKDQEIAVVDIGMNTLDLYVVESGNVVARYIGGSKLGVRRLYDLMRESQGADLEIAELDEKIANGSIKFDKDLLRLWLDDVLAEIEKTWPKLARFSAVIPAGGGAKILGKMLVNDLSIRGASVHAVDDPVTTNVTGLYKYTAYKASKE